MNTVAAWIKEHPRINALAFERNSDKSFGFGDREEVCGFCLASHYFQEEAPELCKFCRAPFRDTHVISHLSEVTNRVYDFRSLLHDLNWAARNLPFIVWRNSE